MNKNYSAKERQEIEREFYNKSAVTNQNGEFQFELFFHAKTAIENQYVLSLMSLDHKRILDIGCGEGEAGLYFAKHGANVDAIDISSRMIKSAEKFSRKYHLLGKIRFQVMEAENLKYPDRSFDFVYGNSILHHTTIDLVLKQVSRVLKKGGKAVFIEPLRHNMFINMYRKVAVDVRTPTEIPMDYSSIAEMGGNGFRKISHKEFHLFTLSIFIWFYFILKINPNKERYWKKIIYDSKKYEKAFSILNKVDKVILTVAPFLRKYCWNTVIVLEK